jgi:hypothetical protein
MSRSKKGKKGAGYEYWGKRPGKLSSPGKEAKKATHRLERLQSKKITKKESEE